jgi:hypothetical protein
LQGTRYSFASSQPLQVVVEDKQKDRMAALIRITTGNLSQASRMIAPIMADVKPLGARA